MLSQRKLPSFATVTAGADNDCFIPNGNKVHVIWLEAGDADGTTLEGGLLGDITVLANNAPQWQLDALQLVKIQSLRGPKHCAQTFGVPGTAGYRTYIPIWFAQPWVEPRANGNVMAWNCAPGVNLTIRVEIPDGIDTPVLKGFYEFSPLDGGLGAITKLFRQGLQVSGTSNDHTVLPKKDLIQSIHLFPPTSAIYVNQVKITRNNIPIRDQITHLWNQASLIGRGWSPDTTANPRFDLLFDYEDANDLGLQIAGANEFTLTTDYSASASGTMDAIIERIGPPESQ
jgi:hypothetical protein